MALWVSLWRGVVLRPSYSTMHTAFSSSVGEKSRNYSGSYVVRGENV